MGVTTPNISIYIPAAGETNYDQSFAAGMQNIDQHDHSGGPNKGVPIDSSGLAADSVTYDKLNVNVADTTTGIGTSGTLLNQLVILGLLKSIYQLPAGDGFLTKDGSVAHSRTLTPTANQIDITNGDGVAGNPVFSLSPIVNNTTQPKFLAISSTATAAATGDGTTFNPIYETAVTNVGSIYDATTGIITVNQAGFWLFYFGIVMTGVGAGHTTGGAKLDLTQAVPVPPLSTFDPSFWQGNPATFADAGTAVQMTGTICLPLAVGDTLQVAVTVANSTKTVTVGNASTGFNYFGGLLLW